jgi:ubiquinone/menaquinone biosynthesis C-methylase UbiE
MQGQGTATSGREARERFAPLYDAALALLAREGRWRAAVAAQIAPEPHDVVLDGLCGAGALCLTLARLQPEAEIVGLDPRPALLEQARARAAEAGLRISFIEGAPSDAPVYLGQRTPTQIVLTLVGARSAAEKLAQLQAARQIVDPAGVLHVIDFGRQRGALMRGLFAAFHGGADAGDPPTLIRAAGFVAVEETAAWPTGSGIVSLYRARAS